MPLTDRAAMISELEEAIACITGVDAVRLMVDDSGEIAEIHVVGPTGRNPKRIVRDTESLLRARYEVDIDYRKVSVVQLSPAARSYIRPRLIDVLSEEDRILVTLAGANGEHRCCETISQDNREGIARASAKATLRAASRVTRVPVELALAEARLVRVGNGDVVCVMVEAKQKKGASEKLTGTCIVGHCLPTAAAKATLDAINRRLELWSAFPQKSSRDSQDVMQKGV